MNKHTRRTHTPRLCILLWDTSSRSIPPWWHLRSPAIKKKLLHIARDELHNAHVREILSACLDVAIIVCILIKIHVLQLIIPLRHCLEEINYVSFA
ncbi:hypothetical protein Y032_0048g1573 [Ancylostoma ceylanicum]|uniref:Uncharacterized protein n=1 Tax=Ancylostoma ceylanicum TaxID=53326 RepID=A0A016UAV3_9BILA|nr:hypothetical protein Y032_0048g1573 [Ancylostoma ceylanicum]